MEMELLNLLKIVWRWSWLMLLIVGGTVGIIYYQARGADPEYQSSLTLQVTTPDREDVAIIDTYTWTSDRDEITIVSNNFLQVAEYDQVQDFTRAELGITENYDIEAEAENGADLVYINVTASSPSLAAEIANAHARNAIQYFGELRTRPSRQAMDLFEAEINIAQQELLEAQQALRNFQLEYGIVNVGDEIELQQEVLQRLVVSREQYVLDYLTNAEDSIESQLLDINPNTTPGVGIPVANNVQREEQLRELEAQRSDIVTLIESIEANGPIEGVDVESLENTIEMYDRQILNLMQGFDTGAVILENGNVSDIAGPEIMQSSQVIRLDGLITSQRQRVADIAQLEPEHTRLVRELTRAQETYDLLASKIIETDLKQSFAREAVFLQVIKPAVPPRAAEDALVKNMIFGGAASLGFSMVMVLLLDYLFSAFNKRNTVFTDEQFVPQS